MIKFDLYLCGPMTGLPDLNHTAFNTAAQALRNAGYTVFNPVENGLPKTAAWEEHMRADIKHLMDCRDLAWLAGWTTSEGACLEVHNAQKLKMKLACVGNWIYLKTGKTEGGEA
jgi:hypothetical protein